MIGPRFVKVNYECINIHNTAKCWTINIINIVVVRFIKTQPLNMFTSTLEATCLKLKIRWLSTKQTVIKARLRFINAKNQFIMKPANEVRCHHMPDPCQLSTQQLRSRQMTIGGSSLGRISSIMHYTYELYVSMEVFNNQKQCWKLAPKLLWFINFYSINCANSLVLLTKHIVS